MKVGSLFSGIGGIELGFEMEGFETVWFVEKDEYAKAILRKQWPEAVIYDDVSTVDWSTVREVDVLTGGFPCQDISNAGKRVGITGSRSSLWRYYAEAIRVIRPKYALIENVAALTSRGLDVVLADLAKIGYDAEWYNISASSVGALHRRERVFIICYANNNGQFASEIRTSPDDGSDSFKNWEKQTGKFTRPSSTHTDVAYSESRKPWEQTKQERGKDIIGRSQEIASNVSNSCIKGLQGQRESFRVEQTHSNNSFNGWWAVEPDVGRVANGIPNRVDRIKCLGNAVVPQCAQIFAQAIKEQELKQNETKTIL